MTDRDGRCEDSKTCQTKLFTQNLIPSGLTVVTLNNTNIQATLANTDSDGDYETSSEGPHSPRTEFYKSFDANFIPESNDSLLVNTTLLQEEDSKAQDDPSVSYTIIGRPNSPRIDVTSKVSNNVDQTASVSSCSKIRTRLNGLDELEARRTEYFVASRIETEANRSESLPVITIATPWGSYEYPDVHMPAERLVSDSPVDIKEKMRLIASCMDGSELIDSKSTFFNEPSQFFYQDVKEDCAKRRDGETDETASKEAGNNSGYSSRPQTPKIMSVTSPKIFSEAFNVLPIIRNPNFGSDYTCPPSLSGSSLPVTANNNPPSISSSFHLYREAESPQNFTVNKSSYDPLSRIEGELAPLQNELSEIRGKVRALNLDYNLSCIDGLCKLPEPMHWMTAGSLSSPPQIRPVKDDFVLSDYSVYQNQKICFESNSHICKYRYPFVNRSSVASASSNYGLEEIGNKLNGLTEVEIASKSVSHHDPEPTLFFSSTDQEPEVEDGCVGDPPRDEDRKLSSVYTCTSIPSSLSPEVNVGVTESEEETDVWNENANTLPEIRLPDFLNKICIVPIAYLGGMPDPPTEPVFNFAKSEDEDVFRIGHKVLRIEHPDAPGRRRDLKGCEKPGETLSSSSDTISTLDNDTKSSLSPRKDQDDSSIEISARHSDRIVFEKFAKNSFHSHFSTVTDRQETPGKSYIRGLISGPEDFL